MADSDILALKDRAADQFWKISHVDAVGISGRDDTNGAPTGQMVLKIFLNHTTPDDSNLFPASFEGLPVDVVSTAPISRDGTVPGAVSPRAMPADLTPRNTLQGGISIATEDKIGLGTLGCILRDKQDGSAFYGLTNYHIVSIDGKLSRTHRVSHPAVLNSQNQFEFDPVGSLGLVEEGGLDAVRDAAVFRLREGGFWIPLVAEIGYLKPARDITIANVVSGTFEVRKRGSKTGLTGGTIHAIADLRFDEKTRQKNVLLILPNQPSSSGLPFFGFEGDSGSVLVNGSNEVVGIYYGTDEGSQGASPISGWGFAVRIGTVLDLFRDVDGLDLEVAVPANPAATDPLDPAERQKVPFPAGAPALASGEQLRRMDRSFYRPLIGGSQILAERVGSANAGALGCMVTAENDQNEAYVLTSHSALSLNGAIPPTSDTEVGQPDVDKSLSRCCDKFVGKFAKAGPDAAKPTGAIVRLTKDQKWLPEIMRIGVVSGSKTITHSDLNASDPLTVFKSGPASRLTSGTVVRVADSPERPDAPKEAMLIRPHDNPLKLNDEIHFSRQGDRGAAIVNVANEIVGVLYGELTIPDSNGRQVVHGLAAPIAAVLEGLKVTSTVEVIVARADKVGMVKTVSARASLPEPELDSRSTVEPVDDVPDAIRTSPGWREMLEVWQRHQGELRALIDRNRRVATAWHRNGGPALVQAFARAVRVPGETMPPSVNGVPLALCLERLSEAFCRYGSTALVSEITSLRLTASSIVGLTLTEILAMFARTDLTPQPA